MIFNVINSGGDPATSAAACDGLWAWWKCNSTDIYNLVTIFLGIPTLIFGIVGVRYAAKAFGANNAAQREQLNSLLVQNEAILFQNAVQIYRRYIELAIEHPKMAEPDDYAHIEDEEEMSKYEWFVGLLLRACEEILQYVAGTTLARREEWTKIVASQLVYHARYFATDKWFNEEGRALYSAPLMEMIDPIIANWKARFEIQAAPMP